MLSLAKNMIHARPLRLCRRRPTWFLVILAIVCLLAWTFVSAPAVGQSNETHTSHLRSNDAFIIADTKNKEFLDFEDKESEKQDDNKVDVDQVVPKASKSSTTKLADNYLNKSKLRENILNGVLLPSSLDAFDVVGGTDLFVQHPIIDDEFLADENKIVPGLGENGQPVVLAGAEAAMATEVMKKEAFNIIASDKISLHRSVPDTRDPRCAAVSYDASLPTTTVIIIFTNEAWSPLIRTIWSVLDKSSSEYMKEIILVDDASDKKHLQGKLTRYIQRKFPSKVKLLRLKSRHGLIRARLAGARLATGDVLLFLDSHCECGQDWLRPLLQRIKQNPKAFVVPIIDVIDDKTMEYYHGNGIYFQIGGFTWSGHFTWIDIPEVVQKYRETYPVAPVATPTMAGGLFAVDRNYFWESGSYDEEMDVWGGENLEMSFRVWQCGGSVETIPCSRVGHIFRSFHPYSFPGNKDTHGINTARTVEVWMDEYKRLFYMNRPDLKHTDIGNLTNRMTFRMEKQCKSFDWFLTNVYPQKFILDSPVHVFAYGRVKNLQSGMCIDTMQNDDKDSYTVGAYPCHETVSASQFFSFSRNYQLRREDSCAEVGELAGTGYEPIKMVPCSVSENQQWVHTKQGRLIHNKTNKCLDLVMVEGSDQQQLYAAPCKAVTTQMWFFDSYFS